MPTVATTQFLILVRDVFPLRKLPQLSKRAPFFGSVRYFSQVGRENAPLTLASLGLKSDLEALNKRRKNDIQRLEAANEGSKSKVKPIRSAVVKDARVKKSLQIGEAPFAAVSFSELGLTPLLLERLEKEGFDVPTDVQSTAIPVILKNHDVVIQSYTGSGKTLAYLLPILSDVGPLKKKRPNAGYAIVRELEKLLGPENRKLVQQLVGGANRSRQEEALKKNKPAIISAAGKLHTHGCSYLVLDEVDELLKFHFREDMHRILEHVGKRSGANPHSPKGPQVRQAERQTIMVSATVPFSVIRAARSWGKDPLLVQAKNSGPSSNVQNHGAITSLPPNLKHYYCITRLQHKVDSLRRCVHALDAKAAIVFMNNTKQLKDAVYKLEARGINAAESTILKKFKNGEVRVLVTNELSARGLDVVDCDLVVSLDLPTDAIHYAHRAGRTGRLGRMGTVVTVCEESELFVIKKLQKQLGISIQACEFSEGRLVVSEENAKSK
ncbi:RNA helicase [Bertholletia excelsa]